MANRDETVVNLSEAVTMKLRKGVTLKVYPASLEQISKVAPKISKLEKLEESADLTEQIEAMLDVVYDLVKDDNEDITKETLRGCLTLQAGARIMQESLGSSSVTLS